MTATFVVYGQPAAAGSKRAVQTKAGVRVVDANRKAGPWKDEVRRQVGAAYDGHPLLDGPLSLALTFYALRPKHHYGTGRNAGVVKAGAPRFPTVAPDVLKLARGVEDALTGLVWRDDSQVVWEFLTKLYGEPARVEITVSDVVQVTPTLKSQVEVESKMAEGYNDHYYADLGQDLYDFIRPLVVDVLIREVGPVLDLPVVRRIAREEIASVMAACLADPDVDEHAKSLAGYILQRLGEPGE